jgi:hypothetical protein
MKITEQNKEDLKQWLTLEFLFVQPIEKIVKRLESKEYGDGDIDYLENRLDNFMDIAAKALDVTGRISHESFTVMNEYTRKKYIEYFSILLMFFKVARDSINLES